jgi:hypothetical protein
MRILGKSGLLVLWILLLSCDLLFNKPDGNLMEDIEDSVWDSNAPLLQVSIDYIAGAGTTNYAKGLIVPQPKQRIEFAVSFAVNPDYGFVEWRAYETGKRPGSEEEWQAAAASLGGILTFGSPRGLSTTVLIDSATGLITLEPFCVRRPEVDHSDPVWTGSTNRFYTNQPIRVWFTMPIERASVENFNNISISAVTFQGGGEAMDLVGMGYFKPPELDGSGTMLLINPDMDTFPDGIPSNSDITIRLDLNIRHDAFTGIDGGAGLRMARPFAISYGTTGGPDKFVPQVLHIMGAERETDPDLFDALSLSLPVLHYRQNKAELHLLFNAYKPTETPIRDVLIYELPESAAEGTIYPVEELLWNVGGSLEARYLNEYAGRTPPLSEGGRTKVRYAVRSRAAGRVDLYILPEDMLGNKVTVADAKAQNYVMPVIIDPPPEKVTINAGSRYNGLERHIELRWTPPGDTSLEGVTLLKVEWLKNGVPMEMPNSTIPAIGDSRFDAGAWDIPNINGDNEDVYTITIRALDGYENDSLSEPVTIRADSRPPGPVTGFNAAYDSENHHINLSWSNPSATDLDHLTLVWDNAAGDSGNVELVRDTSYTVQGVSDGFAEYLFTIKAVDTSGNESASAVTGLNPGIPTFVPPVSGLAATYNPVGGGGGGGYR